MFEQYARLNGDTVNYDSKLVSDQIRGIGDIGDGDDGSRWM